VCRLVISMTKGARENQQLPKIDGILRDGKYDGRNDGSNELSIKTESFTRKPQLPCRQSGYIFIYLFHLV
jgi:hypothetical protein